MTYADRESLRINQLALLTAMPNSPFRSAAGQIIGHYGSLPARTV